MGAERAAGRAAHHSWEEFVKETRRNVLVVYRAKRHPLIATLWDHLYCFPRYTKERYFYLNVGIRALPPYLGRIPFDLVIFHTTFLSVRWGRSKFRKLCAQIRRLGEIDAVKVALPQDEFVNTDLLCDFINDFGVDVVFSVTPQSEWPKVYDSINRRRVRINRVLTGYLDERALRRINRMARKIKERPIDIGYRTKPARYFLGRHGQLKGALGTAFAEKAGQRQLVADISTRKEDTILGDDWYRFLLKCKYTIGIEGGASILDRDGKILARTVAYLARHPQASFEETEAACFPGLDGGLKSFSLSPRHLEACATRTCQILVEGKYDGVLKPGDHYIPLKADLRNIDKVLDQVEADNLRQPIVERAYRDIVESGAYTYRGFANLVLAQALGGVAERSLSQEELDTVRFLHGWMRLADGLSWSYLAVLSFLKRAVRRVLLGIFPWDRAEAIIRRIPRRR
jgi:hypothetical protein